MKSVKNNQQKSPQSASFLGERKIRFSSPRSFSITANQQYDSFPDGTGSRTGFLYELQYRTRCHRYKSLPPSLNLVALHSSYVQSRNAHPVRYCSTSDALDRPDAPDSSPYAALSSPPFPGNA